MTFEKQVDKDRDEDKTDLPEVLQAEEPLIMPQFHEPTLDELKLENSPSKVSNIQKKGSKSI